MINFITEYGVFILGCAIIAAVAIIEIVRFSALPDSEQKSKISAWLLGAVIEAEKIFGSKTGQVKLSYVYDKFVEKFPWIAETLPFDTFSGYVDEALVKMKDLFKTNPAIAAIVTGEES